MSHRDVDELLAALRGKDELAPEQLNELYAEIRRRPLPAHGRAKLLSMIPKPTPTAAPSAAALLRSQPQLASATPQAPQAPAAPDKCLTFVNAVDAVIAAPAADCVLMNCENSQIRLDPGMAAHPDVVRLFKCRDCSVDLRGCHPRSVVIQECERLRVQLSSDQLRVHECRDLELRGATRAAPLFENATRVQVLPEPTSPTNRLAAYASIGETVAANF